MYTALIIGCGNIGAMYDFETDSVATYAKAFHLNPKINFEVYDVDLQVSLKVAERYGVRCLQSLEPRMFSNYDIVAICTPTFTHYEYLSKMLECGPSLVICEKPVDTDILRLENLTTLYQKTKTKVLVNYFRRFQPHFIQLKRECSEILEIEKCTNIIITYQRGLHNNASHAIDLLEFLFESTIDLAQSKITNQSCDEFMLDPTMSIACNWNGINLQIIGLENAKFTYFNLDIFFSKNAVSIKDSGDTIEWLSVEHKNGSAHPKLRVKTRQSGAIDNYMQNAIFQADHLLSCVESSDNFLQSVRISKNILKVQGK